MANSLSELRPGLKRITFDCYGTLVDWERALESVFMAMAAASETPLPPRWALHEEYLRTEAEIEGSFYRPYREVQAEVLSRMGRRFGIAIPPVQRFAFSEAVMRSYPFVDTHPALARLSKHFALGVLSNIDRVMIDQTLIGIGIRFDPVITAEDVRAYKPSPAHFNKLLASGEGTSSVLHAAVSLYHDGVPAQALGIPFVWINRRQEVNTTKVRPVAIFNDLTGLADALEV